MKKRTYVFGQNAICACMEQIYFAWRNGVSPSANQRKCVRIFGYHTYSVALKVWSTALRLLYPFNLEGIYD